MQLRPVCYAVLRGSSPKVPNPEYKETVFGRDIDIAALVDALEDTSTKVINILGPPGIGKSTLAKCIGNEMILHFFIVHYVDMDEFTPGGLVKNFLAEKIDQTLTAPKQKNVTFSDLKSWVANLPTLGFNHMIILDNCDSVVNSEREAFIRGIEELLEYSYLIKFLVTSREELFSSYYKYKVQPLTEVAAYELLDNKKVHLSLNEKKQIAELTGEVPIALKIVASLLSFKLSPPTPSEIIDKLRSNPIPALSKSQLVDRINHTIYLSYGYLDKRLQKRARYLAQFPGSFAKSDVIELFNSTHTKDDLSDLVTRSLLEQDVPTDRYRFHRLIKEFFLFYSSELEGKKFDLAFQRHFGLKLCKLNEKYLSSSSPKEALNALDTERHNFYHIMAIYNKQYLTNRHHPWKYSNSAISCLNAALSSRFLGCRFSVQELVIPFESLTNILGTRLTSSKKSSKLVQRHYTNFLVSLNNLLYLQNALGSRYYASDLAMNIVEEYDSLSDAANTEYIKFYTLFLASKPELSRDELKLYHSRILKKTEGVNLECESWCELDQLGYYYFQLGDHEKSVQCYENTINGNSFSSYPIPLQADILISLRKSYIEMMIVDKVYETNTLLWEMFPLICNQTAPLVHQYNTVYWKYVDLINECEETNITKSAFVTIVEKMLETFYVLGKKGDNYTLLYTHQLTKIHFNMGNFSGAHDMGILALEALEFAEDIRNQTILLVKIEILMILSKSSYSLNNFTEANSLFVQTMDLLLAYNLTNHSGADFIECCKHLFFLSNYKYLSDCSTLIMSGILEIYHYLSSFFTGASVTQVTQSVMTYFTP